MEVLGRFVGLPLFFSEVVEKRGGGVFVGLKAGEINRFLGWFPGLSIHYIQDYCVGVFIFSQVSYSCVTRQPVCSEDLIFVKAI